MIQDGAHGGEFNMGADVYLSQEAARSGQIILRLYTWNRPTLSLGYHQELAESLRESCASRDIPIVRRPTGGRAVLHDQELTYCLALPINHQLIMDGKDKLQERIGQAFVSVGQSIGLQPRLARRGVEDHGSHARLVSGSPLCFDSVSRWEVRLNGRKWIGSAQRIFPNAYLQHGSILLGKSTSVLEISNRYQERQPRDDGPCEADLRQSIPQAFGDLLGVHWAETRFDEQDIAFIRALMKNDDPSCRFRAAS
ncbi:MAG TPA: hypothetical protein VF398_00480 [bacterium]